ncbi:MAG: elongation factor P [Planctomycetes bacterium]|nr:elongation factor P [Planctomycetota bacterium]
MPSIGVNQVSRGTAINWNGEIYICVGMEHIKPGKGPAYVQMKLKNAITGRIIDNRFRSQDTVDQVDVDRGDYTFSYVSGDKYVFMHTKTYEEVEISDEAIGDRKDYLVEGNTVTLCTVHGSVLSIELPKTVVLEVIETEPGIKNASATNVGKPATTNTGLIVTVPPFINQGDRIKVDTENGTYMERYNA